MKPTSSQRAIEIGLRGDDAVEQRAVRLVGSRRLGIMPGDDMIGERFECLDVPADGEVLEGADPDVA